MRGTGGHAVVPGDQIPRDRADEGAEEHVRIHELRVEDPFADGGGDVQLEKGEGHEVEEGGPDDGLIGA